MADDIETWLSSINSKGEYPYTPEQRAYYVVEENDIGTPRTRSRSTKVNTIHNFKIRFTHEEWEQLKAWVQYNLANGTLPFNFPHPATGNYEPMRFTIEQGQWYSSFVWTFDHVSVVFRLEQLNG